MFVYGFPKNVRSNLDKDEEESLKLLATELLGLTPEGLGQAVTEGTSNEVEDAQSQV